jgi:hypothetical protein
MTPESKIVDLIREILDKVSQLDKTTPTDEQLADAVGDVRAIEVRLADTRHRWESLTSEMEPVQEHDPERRIQQAERAGTPVVVGQRYELVPQFKTERTFNDDAILVDTREGLEKLAGAEVSLERTLRYLEEKKAIKISWLITGVRAALKQLEVPLRTQYQEIEAGDVAGAHVGEWQKPNGVKRVPIKEEEE